MIKKNIISLIGHTPLVQIQTLHSNPKVKIFAKLEGQNPTGSIKDRIAISMISKAIETGELNKQKIILEATSGNTGISLAMVAAVLGYNLTVTMSKAVSKERQKIIKAYGANIILTSEKEGTAGAISQVKKLIQKHPEKYFYINQHNNPNNPKAHQTTTGPEIWQQTKGKFNFVVCSIGTTGTIMGIAKFLKSKNKKIKIIGAQPILGHSIQGLRNLNEPQSPRTFQILNEKLINQIIPVSQINAIKTAQKTIQKEGLFVGPSSGAALYASILLAKTIKKGIIITILPDRAEKYLSTDLFQF